MKNMRVKIVSLLTALVASLSASGCYLLPDEEEVLAPPVVKASEVKYSTVTVSRKDLVKKVTSSGTVTAEKQYMLTYEKQGGTISKFYVRAGDEVKEGDPICELETTDVDYQITEKELYKRRAELGVAIVRQNGGSQAEIDRAGVEVELIENELEKLYERKEQAVLTSPIDGIVSALADVRVGDGVGTGQNIATVIDTSGLYIPIKPNDMKPYDMGTELVIKVGDTEYEGEVFMTPSALGEYTASLDEHAKEDNTGIDFDAETVYVRFKGDAPTDTVGRIADCTLIQEKVENAIVISNNLIKTVDGQKVVYLLKDGEKTAVPVEIGLKTGSQSEIISGLQEGDEIVIR
ncbi:MAG: efflux RND transporter periplasmic adaptor subunit [Ruminococcus sp.]|nr:efflux RND transporter periplasmic adaptor subunit [Ruminococcus sp.]